MINDYKIGKMLGEGASGQVRQATNVTDKSKCALKIFHNKTEMLRNETLFHSQLVHKHIVRQIDAKI